MQLHFQMAHHVLGFRDKLVKQIARRVAEPSDPRAANTQTFIPTLYAAEREIKVERDKQGGTFADVEV